VEAKFFNPFVKQKVMATRRSTYLFQTEGDYNNAKAEGGEDPFNRDSL
jgi:hypothetical protein